jgi:hypothetical protein
MLEHTTHLERLLIAAAGVTLALGMAASAGAMPGLAVGGPAPTEVVAQFVPEAAPPVATLVDVPAPPPAAVVEVSAPVVTPAAVAATTPTKKPPAAASTKTQPPVRAALVQAPVAALAAAVPAPAVPAAVATVARRTPSSEEIKSTISELKRQVGGLLRFVSPTTDQINQAGDQVCTGFDNGETFSQVKANGLSMMPSSVDVSEATADWAVRQLVTMYCPGHADKLA